MEISYSLNTTSSNTIYNYLIEVADSFIPNLNERVVNIKDYVEKIKSKAIIFEAKQKDHLVGMLAAYFNDHNSNIAFITTMSVAKLYQNKGIAKSLMLEAIKYGKEHKFNKIRLEVNKRNEKAIVFYKIMNYSITNISYHNEFIVMELCI
ncbi:MAG: GNAT family N-acetyltransferase [Actinomycetota bacterium]